MRLHSSQPEPMSSGRRNTPANRRSCTPATSSLCPRSHARNTRCMGNWETSRTRRFMSSPYITPGTRPAMPRWSGIVFCRTPICYSSTSMSRSRSTSQNANAMVTPSARARRPPTTRPEPDLHPRSIRQWNGPRCSGMPREPPLGPPRVQALRRPSAFLQDWSNRTLNARSCCGVPRPLHTSAALPQTHISPSVA